MVLRDRVYGVSPDATNWQCDDSDMFSLCGKPKLPFDYYMNYPTFQNDLGQNWNWKSLYCGAKKSAYSQKPCAHDYKVMSTLLEIKYCAQQYKLSGVRKLKYVTGMCIFCLNCHLRDSPQDIGLIIHTICEWICIILTFLRERPSQDYISFL